MLRNYFNIIFRNLLKFKLFSFINILGLSLAIACSILVILYVQNELSYDSFHTKSERIYRPYTFAKAGEEEAINVHTPFILGKQLKENYPEIMAYSLLTEFYEQVTVNDQSFDEEIHVASADFFKIFDFKILQGITENVFDEPSHLVITKDIASKYFGRNNVVGEQMSINVGGEKKIFTIMLVLDGIPSNSSIRFSLLVSDHHLKDIFPEPMLNSWHMITGETYLLLNKGIDPEQLTTKFSSLIEQVLGDDLERMEFSIFLQPIMDIHLNTELPPGNAPVSDPKYIIILTTIAVFILVIASINFVMLSLGRSFMRAKEIGIRKSTGATQSQLFIQFLSESIFIALLGLVVGIGFVFLSIHWFNDMAAQHLVFKLSPLNLVVFILLTVATGILAGLYPAFIMSGFKPVRILKGEIKYGKGNNIFGGILITAQFILFIILIGCSFIIKKQLNFMQHKNLGYDKENVLMVPMKTGASKGVIDIVQQGMENVKIIENEVRKLSAVSSTGAASHTFEPGTWTNVGYSDEDDRTKSFFYNTIDAGFIPTLNIRIIAGRNFEPDNLSDQKRSIIVNQSFVDEFGLTTGVGERIPHEFFDDHEIIGIVEDFHIQSLHTKIEPLVLAMNINITFSGANNIGIGSSVAPKLFIRLKADRLEEGLAGVRNVWNNVFPGETFDYGFVDQSLQEQYERESNLNKVVTSSSLIAVIIGCLGLFGISILSYNNRIKEISIRKVLGASGIHILMILGRRFVYLLFVAFIISVPVIYQLMQNWLKDFEYKANIQPWIFLLAGFVSLLIIIATLSYQGLSALRTNPADILRNE